MWWYVRVDILRSVEANERGQDGQADDESPSHLAGGLAHHQVAHPEAEEDTNCDEQLIECACGSSHGTRQDWGEVGGDEDGVNSSDDTKDYSGEDLCSNWEVEDAHEGSQNGEVIGDLECLDPSEGAQQPAVYPNT